MKLTYNFATREELDLIHKYSMRSLEEVGVGFLCDDAVEIFKSHGFRTEGQIVYMTEDDVWNALKTAPKTFEWCGRGSSVTVGGGSTICAPAYGPVFILEDGEYHAADKRDYLNFTKLHASSKVLQVSNPNMMDFTFVGANASNWAMATTLALDTRPAIGMVDGKKNAIDSIKMAQEFYGIYDKSVVAGLISIASPFHYSTAMCESLIEYAEAGQCVFITPSSLNSLTVPGSLASLVLVNNTEVLAGIVLTQLINPGTPVIYGNQSHGCDLRYASPSIGSPEQCLIFQSVKAMGDYYGLPVRTGGSSCDAKEVDMQAGVESFSTMYSTLQSGADLMVHSCGSLDSDSSLSYDKFIYDEEVLLSAQRMVRGFEVSEDTLFYDAIKEIGPGGCFLDLSDDLLADTTAAYIEDYVKLQLPSREGHAQWVAKGCEKVTDRTSRVWKKRLEEYQMPELEPERREILERYVPKEMLDF
ncbi:MAG: trimethylamine methyltransferase family protein [Butyricicoccus sp.]